MNFNDKYQKIKHIGQSELEKIELEMTNSINVQEPLNSYLKEFLTLPSKRIRPLLAILHTKALGKTVTPAQIKLLTVVEIVHNASLIHDDIIDKSNVRRGHKTLGAQFDNKLAVISGDYLLSIAMEILTDIDNIEIIKRFSKTIKQMCIGEINQNFNRFKIGTIEDYIEKTKNKTAYLFETALIGCATLGTESDLDQISQFGLNIGTAFQIRDDLINFLGKDNAKPNDSDINEGIYNAPVIYAGTGKDYSLGIEKTRILLNNYIQNAQNYLNSLPQNIYTSAMKEFLELINNV